MVSKNRMYVLTMLLVLNMYGLWLRAIEQKKLKGMIGHNKLLSLIECSKALNQECILCVL